MACRVPLQAPRRRARFPPILGLVFIHRGDRRGQAGVLNTHTHTIARQTGNNSVSECQNPRQLDIKQDRACPTPIGAFLQYRVRGGGTSCSRSRPSPALGSRAER